MSKKKSIKNKLTRLIASITVGSLIIASVLSIVSMLNMRSKALETASQDAIERLTELAENRASQADSMLKLAQNQTLLVAEGAKHIIENADEYLAGYNNNDLPNLSCSENAKLGEYSVHTRMPENLLKNIKKDSDGNVEYAEINSEASTSGSFTVEQELYLASCLSNEFAQIERFKNSDGDYNGFSASYFCFADSGIDVLGDSETQKMVCYDGRERGWYKGAVEAYENGTLTESGVYWTDPVQDGSGRGISMICAAPVVVDGEIVGVAGSGGLLVDFAELVKTTTIGSTGFSFMVSRSNTKVIINPNTSAKSSTQSEVMIETDLSNSSNSQLVDLANMIKTGDGGSVNNVTIDGKECYVAFSPLSNNDWTMVTVINTDDEIIMDSYNELNLQIRNTFIVFFVIVLILNAIAILISNKFSDSFTNPIIKLKDGVSQIGNGDLNQLIDVNTGDEIEELGCAFNDMAVNLDKYINNLASITAEKERIGAELDVAKHIQESMLPSIFPSFENVREFDISAFMQPAKEVGGDFYDFFMVDERHIALVMADVSGKGIPAALFMVIGKTLIKDHTQPDTTLSDVFTKVNNLLCESNSEGLFITAFEGVLDLATGEFNYVNAGHELPYICKADGAFEAYKIRPGFVLAGMENIKYKAGSITLDVGDKIFQYTDGVTEATNCNNNLFGIDRLKISLNAVKDKKPNEILKSVKNDIDEFVGKAPQFDDITMLCLEFKNKMIVDDGEELK